MKLSKRWFNRDDNSPIHKVRMVNEHHGMKNEYTNNSTSQKVIEYNSEMLEPQLLTTPRLPDNGLDLKAAFLEVCQRIPFDSIRCVIWGMYRHCHAVTAITVLQNQYY